MISLGLRCPIMDITVKKRPKKIETIIKKFDRAQIPISELLKIFQSIDLTKYDSIHFDTYYRKIVGFHYQTPEEAEREHQALLLKKQRAEEKRRALELRKIEQEKQRKINRYQKLKTELSELETELQSI